ncbi:MAG: hypothetical protein NC420_02405 [Eubacterium sp.]|nr:hypothetical protein [Eubacterium sp.]MCM1214823.1 hypothetical protein [Lachnospiraceae bacterium]MCM1238899.1 hypothetical protein [Lachnospiraceae bacterium]
MKKHNLQKVLAATLASVMVVGTLTACGGGDDASASAGSSAAASTGSSAAASTASSEASQPAADVVPGIDGFVAFENTVTLNIPVYQRATPNGAADAGENYWTAWIQKEFGEKYNIDVNFKDWVIPRGQENDSYALWASTQSLPTICFEYDYPDLTLYQSEGYLQEYDVDWFKQIAPTYWAAMEENGLDEFTEINGENVLLIGTRPYGQTNYQFVTFYRKDWVEAAGWDSYPTDPDELLQLYAKIDELGLCNGDYLLGGTKIEGNGVDQNYSYRSYPLDKELWATTGDYDVPALPTEAQKALLKWNNQLYNLGYIDKEYNTKTSDYAISDFVSGKCFTWSTYSTNNIQTLDQFYEANPDGKLGIVVNPGPETYANGTCTAFRPNSIFGQYIGFSATATEDEMKAFAMYLEWMSQPDVLFTLQWGEEGVNFNYDENGTPKAIPVEEQPADKVMSHNNNVDMWCLVTATASQGSVDKDIQAITPVGYPDSDQFFEDIKANYEGQLACYNAGMAAPDCSFTVSIAANDEYKTTLYTTYAELRDKIVMGSEADFEANYEAACKTYLDAGYQAIIDEKKAAFEAGNYVEQAAQFFK